MLVYVVVQRSFTEIALNGRLLSCAPFMELLDQYFAVSFLFFQLAFTYSPFIFVILPKSADKFKL